jgi:hypothetical protein
LSSKSHHLEFFFEKCKNKFHKEFREKKNPIKIGLKIKSKRMVMSWPTNICETVKATTNLMKYFSQEFLKGINVQKLYTDDLKMKRDCDTVSSSVVLYASCLDTIKDS